MMALLAAPRTLAGDHLPRAKPEEVGVSSERLHRIDDVIRRHIDQRHLAGGVTLVAAKAAWCTSRPRGSRTSSPSSR